MAMTTLRFGVACSAIVTGLAAGPAFAQDMPAQGTSQPMPSQEGTADQAADEGGGVNDIVITAERRTQSVQRSSLAIEVFSSDALRDAGVSQARDITALTPGVVIGQGGSSPQIYIRGVGDFTSTPITNPAVAVNVDGVYIARSQSIEGNFYDLERIEVLKGPQGTLYGRNSSGGSINLITNHPRLGISSLNLLASVGDYELVSSEAAVNLPLGENVAIRLAGQIVHRNGYSQRLDDDVHQAIRLQLYWAPSHAFNLRLSGDYAHIGGRGAAYVFKGVAPSIEAGLAGLGIALPTDERANGTDPQLANIYYGLARILNRCVPNGALASAALDTGAAPITGIQGFCPAGQSSLISPPGNPYFPQTAYQNNQFWNFSAEANYDFGFATLTVLPAYRGVSNRYVAYPLFTFNDSLERPDRSDSYSLETRLANTSDALTWVVGAYYFNEEQSVTTSASAGLIVGGNVTRYELSTKSYALFGQATYSVTDALRLIGGIRYTIDHKEVMGQALTQYPAPLFFAGGACFRGPVLCPRDIFVGDRKFRRTSWRVGAEYDLSPDNMLFATVSTGHKMGSFNPFSLPGTVNTASSYEPERVLAFELGSRNRFFDNRLQLNIEAFYWDYKDAQQFITTLNRFGAPANALTNAGQATVYGVDVDLTARPTPNDTLHVGAEYLHTNFDSFTYSAGGAVQGLTTGCPVGPGVPFPIVDCDGKPLPRAPRYSGTASYTHRFGLADGGSVEVNFAAQLSGSRFLTIDYTDASRADAYFVGDLMLRYNAPQNWTLSAWVRNVTDELYYTGGFSQPVLAGLLFANVGAPRTYGVTFEAHF